MPTLPGWLASMSVTDPAVGMSDQVVIALITSGFALLTAVTLAVIALYGQRTQKATSKRIEEQVGDVHEQTKNNHETNLRDDLDEVLDMVRRVPPLEVKVTEHIANSESIVSQLRSRDRTHGTAIAELTSRTEEQAATITKLVDLLPEALKATPAHPDPTEED